MNTIVLSVERDEISLRNNNVKMNGVPSTAR